MWWDLLKAVAGKEVGFFLGSYCFSNPTLDLFGLCCDHLLPFFCCLHSHKAPNSLLSWTDESQSPAPQKPAEAIPWWASGGQLSSYCWCCLCQLNTVTFDLSFFPLCLSISASCRALWTLEKKEAPFRLAWPQLCQKKTNKRGKIFYSEINSQPFTVKKKKYFVCWVVV